MGTFIFLHGNCKSFDHIQAADQIKKLYNLFLKIDATQVEVNPFGETPEGQGKKLKEINECIIMLYLCKL